MKSRFPLKYKRTILVLIGILLLCLLPISKNVGNEKFFVFIGFDKWVHFILYFTLFNVWSKENQRVQEKLQLFVYLAIFFGGFVEICQALGPFNRTAEWSDFFADLSGILFGVFRLNQRQFLSRARE